MRILWFSHFLPYPPKDGEKIRSLNLIREVSSQHSVYLIALNHEKIDNLEAIKFFKQFNVNVKIINFPTNKYYKYNRAFSSLFYSRPYVARWLHNQKVTILLNQVIQESKFDIVHFDSIDLCIYLKEVNINFKVLNHHNVESQMMFRRSYNENNLLKKLYFFLEAIKIKKYEKEACPKFDYNLTVSELDKKRLHEVSPELNIEVIPNGANIDYFQPGIEVCENNSLIFAGGMNWYPNRDAMLYFAKEIWPILKKQIPAVKMTVVGRNPPSYVSMLGRQDSNFFVAGFVKDIRPYLERSLVYVCPIRDGGGTKLKILEASAMGKAIVAHPIAIEGIDVEGEKHLLIAETPLQFVTQIIRLFKDSGLRTKISQEARRLAIEKYDYKKIGRKLSELYSKKLYR